MYLQKDNMENLFALFATEANPDQGEIKTYSSNIFLKYAK